MSKKAPLSKWQRATLWFMAAITAAVVVYDVIVAFFNDEKRDTISRMVQWLGYEYWSFAFAIGAVFIGHFFLYGKPVISYPLSFFCLLGTFGILLTLDLLGWTPSLNPLVFLAIGALAGRLFWPITPL